MKLFDSKRLVAVMRQQLAHRGVDLDVLENVVSSLIQTSLRGVDSHGINLFPHYCRAVDAGRINARPNIIVERTATSTATLDADHTFGHHAGAVAMQTAIKLAKESGMGAVSVSNSTHFGAASYFGHMAPENGCLGFAFTNADALVKAFGSKEAFFGTNPICFTAPLEKEDPLCLDMATSIVSWNKINNYRREGIHLPVEWACDVDGISVTDPQNARMLNPIGGYKGFGLGMMVDIFCALLAGGVISKDILPMYTDPLNDQKRRVGHFFMALNIEKFIDVALFKNMLQGMVDRLRILTPLEGGEGVMVPGDPEKRWLLKRIREGIPLDDAKFAEFIELSEDFKKALI